MSFGKIQKVMLKMRRSRGHNAEFVVFNVTQATEKSAEIHNGEELTTEQRNNFRLLLYDNFPELRQPMDSPPLSRQWDHPIDTTVPIVTFGAR
jgi:hypothetical protein